MPPLYADYDRFAWLYNRYWGDFSERIYTTLQHLVLSSLPAGARVLDLCCGAGQLASLLTQSGYQVTGVDGSAELLRFARENAPAARFLHADARDFQLEAPAAAAFCVYDSLNHIMQRDELEQVFANVYAALEDGAPFCFDVNTESGFRSRWNGGFNIVREDHVAAIRAEYEHAARIGTLTLTLFFLETDGWQRSDITLRQYCYQEEEIRAALKAAGFAQVQVYDALSDLNMRRQIGRAVYMARKA